MFGDYISIYDIQRAVEDGATVPIYYESRLAKLELDEAEQPKIDAEFEEVTEGEEVDAQGEAQDASGRSWRRWSATEKRLALIAADLVEHFEKRLEAMDGKAMIVCMSRRICVELYDAIVKLRPDWHSDDDDDGRDQGGDDRLGVRSGRTGSRTSATRRGARRWPTASRTPNDPFKLVIVRDMWLTGFDAPCLHTMYVDKPMRGHGLMQAIARVNRVFRDKPGGLVVDYLGLADRAQAGARRPTPRAAARARPAIDQDEAVAVMLEKYEVCCGLFHGFDWSTWITGTPAERLALLPPAQEHILEQEDGKDRLRAGRDASCRRRSPWLCRTTRRCASATTSASSRPCGPVLAKRAPGEAQDRRGARPRRPAARLAGRRVRRGDRHLRRRRAEEAGHLDPVRRVPGRSARHAAAEPRRRAAAEAAERTRSRHAPQQEPRAGAVVRRDAGADDPRATRTAPSRRRR